MGHSVGIVEDDPFTRVTLSGTMRALGFDVVFETGSASEALSLATQKHPEVVLLDLHLGPGPTGIDVALALKAKQPQVGIVVLSSFEDPRLLNPGLPALPSGTKYIMKSEITHAQSLKSVILEALTNNHSANEFGRTKSEFASLSNTQIETLRLMASGLSNAEIAKRRFVTERSVEISIARLAKKLGIEKNASKNQRVNIAKIYFRATGKPLDDFD